MRVLVCGGRDFWDRRLLFDALDKIHQETPITVIIHGAARGADTFGSMYAKYTEGVSEEAYPAPWRDFSHPWSRRKRGKYGYYNVMAGPIRNQQMIDEGKPDLVVAFEGGNGTQDMICRAKQAGIEVREV
jgi:hypothetical protein